MLAHFHGQAFTRLRDTTHTHTSGKKTTDTTMEGTGQKLDMYFVGYWDFQTARMEHTNIFWEILTNVGFTKESKLNFPFV